MHAFPILDTPRLHLREIQMDDAPQLLAIHGDAQAMKWFGIDPLTELAQAVELVETFAAWRTHANPGTRWGLQLKGEDRLIGNCGLFKWNRGWQSCSLGFALLPSAWGNGLMGEALEAVLAWGFTHMQLNRVEALVHPRNQACLSLLERQGFSQEGRLREAGFWSGRHCDLLMLSRLRSDRCSPQVAS